MLTFETVHQLFRDSPLNNIDDIKADAQQWSKQAFFHPKTMLYNDDIHNCKGQIADTRPEGLRKMIANRN